MEKANGVIGNVTDKQNVLASRVPSGMERAEIESAIATAKKYPRSIKQFQANLLAMATIDEKTAAACFYSVPRAGKRIEGASIRLAEMAMICFQNIAVDGDIVGEDAELCYAQGTCRDLENNVLVRQKVSRRIVNKDGVRFNIDMIHTTQMAAVSIAMRNAITRVVPKSLTDPILAKCKLVAVGKAKDFHKKRTEVLDKLIKMGAEQEDILEALDRRSIEDIDGDDLAHLIGLGTAIHDGSMQVENAFPKSETPAEPLEVEPIATALDESLEAEGKLTPGEVAAGKTATTKPPTEHAKKVKAQAAKIKAQAKAEKEKAQKKTAKKAAKKKTGKSSNLFGGK